MRPIVSPASREFSSFKGVLRNSGADVKQIVARVGPFHGALGTLAEWTSAEQTTVAHAKYSVEQVSSARLIRFEGLRRRCSISLAGCVL